MHINFDEILSELEYRVSEGVIDLTKEAHVNELIEILKEYGYSNPNEIGQKARVYFSYLNEAEVQKPRTAKVSKGGKWYTADPNQGGKYVGRIEAGKWISAAQDKISKTKPSVKTKPVTPPTSKSTTNKKNNVKSTTTKPASKNVIQQTDAEKRKQNKLATTSTIKKKAKKIKDLKQNKNTKKEFNQGYFAEDGVSDKEFNSNLKVKKTTKQVKLNDVASFFVDKNGNTNFPKKYLKVLTRLLNTKSGSGLTISDFTDVSGAGTLASTMGELLTLMSITIKDEKKSNELFQALTEHVKANGKESIIDIGWVKSAQKVRETLFKRYNRQFGKGNWELEQMAWDVQSEVEELGLENYKENKGFSTDTYAKVKVKGKSILDEISLKKELTANLLNATSGRVQDIMVRGSASEEDLSLYDDLNTKIEALAGLTNKASKEERRILVEQRDSIIEKYNINVPEEAKVSFAQKKQSMKNSFKKAQKKQKNFLVNFAELIKNINKILRLLYKKN
jgi:hypothetical protein